MKERDCANCKHHTSDGCSSWGCEFEAKDLISRADAIERIANDNVVGGMDRINEYRNSNEHNDYLDGISTAIATVDDLPSADAVEVVRCEDCKHLNTAIGAIIVNGEKETVTCDYWCNATYPHVTVQDTEHFCSYGERRKCE